MERLLKWSLPVLIVVNVGLVWSGVLEAGTALLLGVTLELLVLLVALRQVVVAARRYRRDRAAGLDVEAALEDGLAVIFPRSAARVIAIEPRIWICLYRWLFRRRSPAPNEFSYMKRSPMGMLLALVLVSTPVELFLIELLVPWDWLRWLLLIAGIYAALWLLGVYASLKVLPHRLDPDALRIYYGILASGSVPHAAIASVSLEGRKAPEAAEGLRVTPMKAAAYVAVGGRTDLTLHLREPVVLYGLTKPTPPVSTIHLAADNPEGLLNALHGRIALPL